VAENFSGLVRAEGRNEFLLNIPVKIRGRRTDDKQGISIIIIVLRSLYGTMYTVHCGSRHIVKIYCCEADDQFNLWNGGRGIRAAKITFFM
jgi:hypothetical protein